MTQAFNARRVFKSGRVIERHFVVTKRDGKRVFAISMFYADGRIADSLSCYFVTKDGKLTENVPQGYGEI